MSVFITQIFKYLILILFIGFVFGGLYVLRYGDCIIQRNRIYKIQRVLLYGVHFCGFLVLYIRKPKIELIGFYMMQLILIAGVFIIYNSKYPQASKLLLNNMCMLLVISLLMLTRISFHQAFRQFVFLIIGVVGMLLIIWIVQKSRCCRKLSVLYGIAGLALLGLVFFLGSTSYGAKLNIAIAGVSFQPSEFVKIVFVLFIASMLYQKNSWKRLLATSVLSALFVMLLVASRDLGGALLYFATYLIVIYFSTGKKGYLAIGSGGILIGAIVGYLMFSHVRTRVFAWLNPLRDIDNKGYQICRSLYSISKGSWFGLGLGEGEPNKIPIVEKDFVFSAISEELGAIFAIGLILLCASSFWAMLYEVRRMKDCFHRLLIVGFATLYATQVILTIGGAIKFIPSTGVTLPLVSYGGSSLLSTLLFWGMLQGLCIKNSAITEEMDAVIEDKGAEITVVGRIFGMLFFLMIAYFVYFMIFQSHNFISIFN